MMNELNLIYVRHNRYGIAPRISPREIPYHELTLLLDGGMEYRINGEAVPLRSGDLILVRKGELRERVANMDRVDYISFNFDCEDTYGLPRYIQKGVGREIQHLIAACDELGRLPGEGRERRIGYLLHCMLLLLRDRCSVSYGPLTEGILRYLHAHMAERITLEQIGREMHFSPVYCDTVFKRETGKSIVSYLLDLRMEEAKRLLLEDAYSIRRIAKQVGFEDHNYFSRTFKKRVGYTPTRYRNSILKTLSQSDKSVGTERKDEKK